jgi:tetratricopeptide (TPR) repeat protein
MYWRESVTLFERAGEVTGPSREVHWSLVYAYARAGRLEDSERECRALLAIDPNFSGAHLALAKMYDHEDKLEQALAEGKEAARLASASEKFDVCKAYGATLLRAGQYGAAAEQLEEASRINPDDAEVRANLEKAREMSGSGGGQTSR